MSTKSNVLAESYGVPANIVLIGHAESQRNFLKRGRTFFADQKDRALVRGIPDWKTPLSEEGARQARRLGPLLRDAYGVPDAVFHSGNDRTVRTMKGFLESCSKSERRDVGIHHDHALRERFLGFAADLTVHEATCRYPWLQDYLRDAGAFFAQLPGGESLAQVADRVRPFIDMLFTKCVGKTVFVFTNGGTIRCFRFWMESWSYDREAAEPHASPGNCSVTHYAFDLNEGRLVLKAHDLDLLTTATAPATTPSTTD